MVAKIRTMFSEPGVGRCPANNLRQADVPEGATVIPQTRGPPRG